MRSRSIWAISPCLEAVAADVDDVVVIVEIGLGRAKDGLGLKGLHEGRAQSELEISLQILVVRFGDVRALYRALVTQFAFVIALVEIADAGLNKRAGERLPNSVMGSDLCPVHGCGELSGWAADLP